MPEPFGPTTTRHAGLELEDRLVGERLEALAASVTSGTRVRLPFSGLWPQRSDGDRGVPRHSRRNLRWVSGRGSRAPRSALRPAPRPRRRGRGTGRRGTTRPSGRPPPRALRTPPRPARRTRLRTQPATPSATACSRHDSRNHTPCTRPRTRTTRSRTRSASDLARVAVERGPAGEALAHARRGGTAGTRHPRARTRCGNAGTRPGWPKRSTYCSSASDEPRYFTASCSVSIIER